MEFYRLSKERTLKELSSSVNGLTSLQVKAKLKLGKNKLKKTKHFSTLKIFLRQFIDPLVLILMAAVILSILIPIFKNRGTIYFHDIYDSIFIGIILALNAILGFVQEYKAEKSVELLKKLSVPKTTVLRNSKLTKVNSENLVPGDILVLNAGDRITADARILESNNLRVNESALTGESTSVTKSPKSISKKVTLANQNNLLFSGTTITQGNVNAVVTKTGMDTELGKIAFLVQEVDETKTPLQKRLTHLGKWLALIVISVSIIIIITGLLNSQPLSEMLLIGVSLAVSAIPEGLPAVITVALALSVNAMVKRKALVKKLKAIETLGNVSVIATDKTGTLTKNEMTVSELFINNQTINVTGTGFTTMGKFLLNKKEISPEKLILEIGANCNNSSLPDLGDPTEIALLVSAAKANVKKSFKKIGEIPFNSERKYMATTHIINNKKISYIKGAPEPLLKLSSHILINKQVVKLTAKQKEIILDKNNEMAKNASRVLAMSYKENKKTIFVGLQGMIDQPRKEVKQSIAICKQAGIRVIMVTGDQKLTAQAIAKKVGIDGESIEGSELDKLTDKQLTEVLKNVNIVSRSTPENKVKILEILQNQNQTVAMTGDGINDAPALKKADVGIAMAIKGTDIARDAADMILLNDNFASIVQAIEQGRSVYENIKKFIKYLLSVNFSELLLILTAILLKLPLPLLPLQILWINLATDGLPALALSTEKSDNDLMNKKPRNSKENIFKGMLSHLIFGTLFIFLASLIAFTVFLDDITKARTMALTVSVFYQMFFAFTCRSSQSLFKIGFFTNRKLVYAVLITVVLHLILMYTSLNSIFQMTPLTLMDWIYVMLLASTGLIFFEIAKIIRLQKILH
jgi:P-type Ca2+ transporter type 2C